jgi:hypothetical protein
MNLDSLFQSCMQAQSHAEQARRNLARSKNLRAAELGLVLAETKANGFFAAWAAALVVADLRECAKDDHVAV